MPQEKIDFAVVTAVSPGYLEKMKLTLPTWVKKPQVKAAPLYVLAYQMKMEELEFIRDYFPNFVVIPVGINHPELKKWDIFRAFFFHTQYIKNPLWAKIDCDTFFKDDQDLFDDKDATFDLVGNGWGYTKPAIWVQQLNQWAEKIKLPGLPIPITDQQASERIFRYKRICSWICLHKTNFTREIWAWCLGNNDIPVPSHDTLAWYMAERLLKPWNKKNFRKLGADTSSSLRVIKRATTGI